MFLLAERTSPEIPFAAGFEEWKAKQPPRYTRANWQRFWSRANALLGYDHTALLGPRNASRIDDGMSVARWMRLLEQAGFTIVRLTYTNAILFVPLAMVRAFHQWRGLSTEAEAQQEIAVPYSPINNAHSALLALESVWLKAVGGPIAVRSRNAAGSP